MIKTITFAILHFSVAFSVAYILTGSIGVSRRGGFGRTHRQYRSSFIFMKSVEPLREKQIREAKNCGYLCISAAKVSDGLLLG